MKLDGSLFSQSRERRLSRTRSRRSGRRERSNLRVETLEPRRLLAFGVAIADYQFQDNGLGGATELFSRDSASDSGASEITSPLTLGSTDNGQPTRGLLIGPRRH